MTGDIRVPLPRHLSDEGVAEWTEPIKRYAIRDWIPDSLLDDGPRLVLVIDDLKARLHTELEQRHMVVHGVVEMDQEYDPMAGRTWVRLWCQCYRDPSWLMPHIAEARAAVLEDQQWLSQQGGD